MGLEAANFIFSTNQDLKKILSGVKNVVDIQDGYYVYKESEKFWIDLKLMNNYKLSIRITMCNPMEEVTEAFISLCWGLLKENGQLYNPDYKIYIEKINEVTEEVIKLILVERKKIFHSLHGDIVLVAGSDEFFNYLYNIENKK